MQDLAARFGHVFDDIARRPGITVTAREVRPGLPDAELRELEEGLEVQLAPAIRDFYRQTNGITLLWSVDPAALGDGFTEEDHGYIGGNIAILDLFTMIMGHSGRRWLDDLYFDFMTEEQQAPFRAFAPFDHTGELAPGFLVQGGRVGPEMRLYEANRGVVPFEHDIESYLARLLETRGFHYWPQFFADTGSPERARYDRAMARLFA